MIYMANYNSFAENNIRSLTQSNDLKKSEEVIDELWTEAEND